MDYSFKLDCEIVIIIYMFIKIQDKRLKISSIGEYEARGESLVNVGVFYIIIKISGKERIFAFSDKSEYEKTVEYLDKTLKVQYV